MPPVELVRQDGFHPTGIDDIFGGKSFTFVGKDFDAVGGYLNVLNKGVLQYRRAIGDGNGS